MSKVYILTRHSPVDGDTVIVRSTFKRMVEMVQRAAERRAPEGVHYTLEADTYMPLYQQKAGDKTQDDTL